AAGIHARLLSPPPRPRLPASTRCIGRRRSSRCLLGWPPLAPCRTQALPMLVAVAGLAENDRNRARALRSRPRDGRAPVPGVRRLIDLLAKDRQALFVRQAVPSPALALTGPPMHLPAMPVQAVGSNVALALRTVSVAASLVVLCHGNSICEFGDPCRARLARLPCRVSSSVRS